ncbi:MAG: hypothetical protein JWQ08_2179 [Deinococcus sp.]|nr:hypothetical protein [Deinococcus sp.]
MNEDARPLSSGEHEVYLLRVWHEFDGPHAVWRASLLLQSEPQRRYFATPAALLHFLSKHFLDEPDLNDHGRGEEVLHVPPDAEA